MSYETSYEYFKRKSKAEMRRELIDNGLWADFVKAREALKENGETVERAWRMAFEAVMSPFDERFDDKEVVEYVREVVDGDPVRPGDPEEEEDDEEDLDSHPPPPVVMDVLDETSKPVRPAAKKKKIGSVTRRSMRKHDVSKETFDEKTCSTPKTVEWVAANIRVGDASAEDAPSSEAWSMLCWVKGSPQAESQFWGQIYTKLLPTRQQLEQDDLMRDDGRVVLNLIGRMREIKEESVNGRLHADAEATEADSDGSGPRSLARIGDIVARDDIDDQGENGSGGEGEG